jgi:hypothetical protein
MNMSTKIQSGDLTIDNAPSEYPCPRVPPPPYFKTYFINPSSFKAAINIKLDNPYVSLFRLSFRLLQFAFALAAGISYAIELAHGHVSQSSTLIYTQIVFGLTILTLVLDSIMIRYYRITWLMEWVLVVLWFVCFAIFYQAILAGTIDQDYQGTDVGRMKRAVWCDLINALLWLGSAIFSSAMCCTGVKATITHKLERRRQQKKEKKTVEQRLDEMESGTVGTRST